MNWLHTLNPHDSDVVGRAAIRPTCWSCAGYESGSRRNDRRDLLRGFLVYLAPYPDAPPPGRCALLTLAEELFAAVLAEMLDTPEHGGQRLPSRTAAAHMGIPIES